MSKKTKLCPVCGHRYSGSPAISRADNKTKICPECGVRQALAALSAYLEGRVDEKN